MTDLLQTHIREAKSLLEVKKGVLKALIKIAGNSSTKKLGYVSGIITSDGPKLVKRNIERLGSHTERLRQKHPFPIFSAADIFTQEVFERVGAFDLPSHRFLKFWREILGSGWVTDIFMTPRWEHSQGAKDEHEAAKELKLNIHYWTGEEGTKLKVKKTITLCSSASFYRELLEIEGQLKKRGFRVKIPYTAAKMKKSGDFDISKIRTWLTNPADYKIKTKLMEGHFRKVVEGDAVLVVNYEKNGIDGYIGGNGLLEMFLAYQNKKPIFVLNQVSDDLILKEEVLGLQPTFIDGDLEKINF